MARATSLSILVRETLRLKTRSDRALGQKKKNKIRVEEGVNSGDSKDEEETTSNVSIPTDTGGHVIVPCTEVIPPDMVLA